MRYYIFKQGPVYLVKILITFTLAMVFSVQFRFIMKNITHLNVKSVEILGNNIVDEKSIEYLSKITRLKNMFKIDIGKSKSLIETHPFIKAVGISVKNFVVSITVVEREPYVFLQTDKKLIVLDKEGYVLDDNNLMTDFDLPILTGIEEKIEYELGEKITNIEVVNGLKWFLVIPMDFWSQVSEINIADTKKITIFTMDGIQIYVDYVKTLSKKFEILYNKLLELKEKKYHIEYFDLRFGDDLIYFEKKGGN
ncbi:MAG: cell division protein FtsQ/DivIB [Candidatus Muiribacteriota bacterium]